MDYLDPAILAVPLYVGALYWERHVLDRRRAGGDDLLGYVQPDTWASLGMGLVSLLTVGVLNLGVYSIAQFLWQWRLVDLGNGPTAWVVGMIAWDFAYYWTHRWEHECRFFWAAHVNHHSSELYNLSTALRQPWSPVLVLVTLPPIVLLGVRPWIMMSCGGLNLIYQFWVHTEAIGRLPRWYEYVFNTSSHHRVHHGSNRQYLDRNHGGIFILWDRLFGTFEPEVERVRYGLTKNIHTYNLWRVFSHEYAAILADFRTARGAKQKFGAVFFGPGWFASQTQGAAPTPQ